MMPRATTSAPRAEPTRRQTILIIRMMSSVDNHICVPLVNDDDADQCGMEPYVPMDDQRIGGDMKEEMTQLTYSTMQLLSREEIKR